MNLDLTIEQDVESLGEIRIFARSFFMDGGALTFDEWSHFHPTVRSAFKLARDEVEIDRLRALGYLIKRA